MGRLCLPAVPRRVPFARNAPPRSREPGGLAVRPERRALARPDGQAPPARGRATSAVREECTAAFARARRSRGPAGAPGSRPTGWAGSACPRSRDECRSRGMHRRVRASPEVSRSGRSAGLSPGRMGRLCLPAVPRRVLFARNAPPRSREPGGLAVRPERRALARPDGQALPARGPATSAVREECTAAFARAQRSRDPAAVDRGAPAEWAGCARALPARTALSGSFARKAPSARGRCRPS